MNAPRMYYGMDWNPGYNGVFDDVPLLVSAGVCWYSTSSPWFDVMTLPDDRGPIFMDSGGFQATAKWDLSYPYSVGMYFNLAEQVGAEYVAGPDYACEPDLHHSSVDERMYHTLAAHKTAQRVYETGEWSFTLVPVLQGYEPNDYGRCAKLYRNAGLDTGYMALGTVCKRDDPTAVHEALDTAEALLPNTDWHLFGLTLDAWKDRRLWGRFRSADTAAWNYGCRTTAAKKEAGEAYIEKVERIRRKIEPQTTLPGAVPDGGSDG